MKYKLFVSGIWKSKTYNRNQCGDITYEDLNAAYIRRMQKNKSYPELEYWVEAIEEWATQ